ncbi:putative transcriptional regulator [Eremomyces bilateralis CBS 781.70]|uniref:Transcriptional regulator n=1 Tax=Eremomyces bilateralis CBS 781.70 TaxID=1392243 RepID=A0A6G1FSH9_9PEZI|nr:putative transcriptional regulator [Eremomyces bilateralis CBS 781.70]KAF1808737.1 putative transcriptional regulator [Eremomyces bilateralis CBS 781.70]
MYLRAIHAESDVEALRQFIQDNPLGILVTALPSSNFPTIQCSHIPWILDIDGTSDVEEERGLGKLRGHMARANPHSKALAEAARSTSSNGAVEQEVSVLFTSKVDSYVTPKFYVKTKPATGKVVPTWNYAAVQLYGRATIYFDHQDPVTQIYLQSQITDLSKYCEEHLMGHSGGECPSAWEVSDAPAAYIDQRKKAIIGIEIDIDRLEGKCKMSQEIGDEDREGVIEGFKSLQTDNGNELASLVQARGAKKNKHSSSGVS